jgi:hypothetical protein
MTLFFCPANVMPRLSPPLPFFFFSRMDSLLDCSLHTIRISSMSAMLPVRDYLLRCVCSVLQHIRNRHTLLFPPSFFYFFTSQYRKNRSKCINEATCCFFKKLPKSQCHEKKLQKSKNKSA